MPQIESRRQAPWVGNPLIAPMGPPVPLNELEKRLAHKPLAAYDVQTMNGAEREILLHLIDQHFVVGARGLALSGDLQSLWYGGLINRDPRDSESRRKFETILEVPYLQKSLIELPWLPNAAKGMIVEGDTGTQKSNTTRRFLQTLGPQVIRHGPNEDAGWLSYAQLVWLYVDMSADGSRGGLLMATLVAMDTALGTTYAQDYAKLTVEKQFVFVAARLAAHSCGLLVIDEMQKENFRESSWQGTFCLFFLRLLNFGVPVVLIGNPQAFVEVRHHGQLLTRLTGGGDHTFAPYSSADDPEYANVFLPRLWEFSVLPVVAPIVAPIRELYFSGSGGITRQICWIHRQSQVRALRAGDVQLTEEHVRRAVSMMEKTTSDLGKGFATRDGNILSQFRDVSLDAYATAGNQPSSDAPPPPTPEGKTASSVSPPSRASPSKKIRAAYNTEQARQQKSVEKAAALKKTLSKNDMRGDAATQFHLGELEQLLQKIEKDRGT